VLCNTRPQRPVVCAHLFRVRLLRGGRWDVFITVNPFKAASPEWLAALLHGDYLVNFLSCSISFVCCALILSAIAFNSALLPCSFKVAAMAMADL